MDTPKYPTRVRTALACRIARVDRIKFEAAVTSGAYTCAPSTISGSARIWDEADVLPLYFFGRLLDFGIPTKRAGNLACQIENALLSRGVEDATHVVLLRGTMGEAFIVTPQNYPDKPPKDYDRNHEANGEHWPGLGRIELTMEFYLKHVRETIADRLAYEKSILGEDE